MPTKTKVDDPEVEPEAEPEAEPVPEPEPEAEPIVDRSALTDELEKLKAEGNKNPARLAEIKKLLAS